MLNQAERIAQKTAGQRRADGASLGQLGSACVDDIWIREGFEEVEMYLVARCIVVGQRKEISRRTETSSCRYHQIFELFGSP